MHPMAPDAVADHVRDQHRGPDHLLGRPLHLPNADHSCRKTGIPTEQVSRAGTTDRRLCVLILLAGNYHISSLKSRLSKTSLLLENF
jgi:hypothetical protein